MGGVIFPGKKCYKGLRFNAIIIMTGCGGCQISRKEALRNTSLVPRERKPTWFHCVLEPRVALPVCGIPVYQLPVDCDGLVRPTELHQQFCYKRNVNYSHLSPPRPVVHVHINKFMFKSTSLITHSANHTLCTI